MRGKSSFRTRTKARPLFWMVYSQQQNRDPVAVRDGSASVSNGITEPVCFASVIAATVAGWATPLYTSSEGLVIMLGPSPHL